MNISDMNGPQLKQLADIMKAIAHPIRLRILCLLRNKTRNVGEMQKLLKKNQAVVSQQLKILRLNRLVSSQRRDGHVFYSLVGEKSEFLEQIMGGLCGCL